MGQKQTFRESKRMSALPPESGYPSYAPSCLLWAKNRLMHAAKNRSFDHFVGQRKHLRWNFKPQGFGRLGVDH
jgi:hypothetical protein